MKFYEPPKRVELVDTNDPYTNLKPGDQGWLVFQDDGGTYCINWDNGSTLGLNPRFGDRFKYVQSPS